MDTFTILISAAILVGFPVAFVITLRYLNLAKDEIKQLKQSIRTISDADEYAAQKKSDADMLLSDIQKRADILRKEIVQMSDQKQQLKDELAALEIEAISGMVRIDAYAEMKSDEVKNQLALLHSRQDELVKAGNAVCSTDPTRSQRLTNTQSKQILRCFNAECANILDGVTVKNADASRAKILRSFEALNKIFALDGVQISQEYLSTKFEELSMVYAYMVKEEEEKEQRRAIREQMVEEEKVRREIERAKQKLDKEEAQFRGEIKKLMSYMQKSKDDIERQLYIDKINELEEKLKALETDRQNVIDREQNARAGFVYIISNIGSFGEQVFKIGMTRRLEPMDRIAELSSASVPFPFDVHAMIFSDDAPGLENILHNHFDDFRINKVNPRKEFFRIDLDEIKKVVLENHNATVKFVDIPDAVEYRETLKLSEQNSVPA